ncbi:hypothetical protein DFH06DRAFT_1207313 [Mycena polygramma]|nr:hypothetical protein DFH06DRAFT_1207313 [Mycena polygramma]
MSNQPEDSVSSHNTTNQSAATSIRPSPPERRPCWHLLFDSPPPNYDLKTGESLSTFLDSSRSHSLSATPVFWARSRGIVHLSRTPLKGRLSGGPISPAAFLLSVPPTALIGSYWSDDSADVPSLYPETPSKLLGVVFTSYVSRNPPLTAHDRSTLVSASNMWLWCLVAYGPNSKTGPDDFAVGSKIQLSEFELLCIKEGSLDRLVRWITDGMQDITVVCASPDGTADGQDGIMIDMEQDPGDASGEPKPLRELFVAKRRQYGGVLPSTVFVL